jgi:polyhydroxybutyrate depolymerase
VTSPLVQARPYDLHVPPHYDKGRATPLVIVLHGYTESGAIQDEYFRMSEVADREGFLVAHPDGTRDGGGNRFWNATDACCDFGGTHVDDVAYVSAVIDDVAARYNVDVKRVYLVGHSNGAFMAYRLACDLAPKIAAIAALAGATWLDVDRCRPGAKVSVLAIHGDADPLVRYSGGAISDDVLEGLAKMAGIRLPSPVVPGKRAYPSAHDTVAAWAGLDGCAGAPTKTGTLDLDTALVGAETEVQTWSGCQGVGIELWTIHGGGHAPALAKAPADPGFAEAVYAFLKAHPRP